MPIISKKYDVKNTFGDCRAIEEATGALIESLDAIRDPENQDAQGTGEVFEFNERDTILYALAGMRFMEALTGERVLTNDVLVGASLADQRQLKFLYENHEDFAVLPTFFIIPALQTCLSSDLIARAVPKKDVDLTNILHGEQFIEVSSEKPCNQARNVNV